MQIIDAPHRLSLARIERAASLIDPVFKDTPQYDCEPLSQALGAALTLKIETMNPLRSFKGRGADYFAHEHAARLAGRLASRWRQPSWRRPGSPGNPLERGPWNARDEGGPVDNVVAAAELGRESRQCAVARSSARQPRGASDRRA